MTPDTELLSRYAATGDEAAFAAVVRRQVNLVYAVALRVCNGNAALAEDVAQAVFTDLARKAGPLSRHPALAGWLHTSARFAALKAIRSEQRRQAHEKEASLMQPMTHSPEFDWDQLRPVLDEAVGRLREKDRAAVVLRFFQGLSHREVGDALGLNENTARKRVDHALEKLRAHFAGLGITVSSTLLASTLSAHPTPPAPPGLAEKIIKPSLTGAVGGGTLASILTTILLMSTKTKTGILAVIAVVAVVATLAINHGHSNNPAAGANQPASIAATVKISPPPQAVAAPASPPVPASPIAPTAPAAPTTPATLAADPRANVDTTIAEAIRALESNDLGTFFKDKVPPDQVANMPPGALEQMGQISSMYSPDVSKSLDPLRFIQGRKPVLSDDGNTATFETDMPLPDGSINHVEIILKKQNGLWYIAKLPH